MPNSGALIASQYTANTYQALRQIMARPDDTKELVAALRLLAKWRGGMVANTIAARSGTRVLGGPFAGMDCGAGVAEGSRSARLLGCYEATLAPVIEEIVARAYPLVIDIGSAEGYYAVGLARRMPLSRILARDQDPQAQKLCSALAALNGVADRVEVAGLFRHADFARALDQPTVVLCDIEGAEVDLLDPQKAPGLLAADILVECHDCLTPGITLLLSERFAASHEICRIDRGLQDATLPPWMEELSDLDRLLALWEWRSGPTPWLWMRHKGPTP